MLLCFWMEPSESKCAWTTSWFRSENSEQLDEWWINWFTKNHSTGVFGSKNRFFHVFPVLKTHQNLILKSSNWPVVQQCTACFSSWILSPPIGTRIRMAWCGGPTKEVQVQPLGHAQQRFPNKYRFSGRPCVEHMPTHAGIDPVSTTPM